jgi:hypothetical protein
MSFFSWLRNWKPSSTHDRRRTHRSAGKPAPFRPGLETLEGRDLPSFAAPLVYPTLPTTVALVTGDLNGDGKPDLISANQSGEQIAVQLNTGKGGFGPAITNSTGPQVPPATALAVGPYRGQPSIFVARFAPGNGTGGMSEFSILQLTKKGALIDVADWEPTPTIGAPLSSLALADLYGDGETDLVAATSYGNFVYVQRLNSSGFAGSIQSYVIPGNNPLYAPHQLAVGDLNGDSRPDIVVTYPLANSVSVLLNTGSGAFGTAQTYAVGGEPTGVAVGDVSGDGKLDIVTANANGTVSVLVGQGNGTFGAALSYAIGGPANSVALGDFNHDGHLDIAATGSTEMDVLLNTGTGTFAAYQKVGRAGSAVVAADFNGDGYPDLAEIGASQASIDVLLNDTDWTNGHKGH